MSNSKFIDSLLNKVASEGYTFTVDQAGDDSCFVLTIRAVMPDTSTVELFSEVKRLEAENKILKERLERAETT